MGEPIVWSSLAGQRPRSAWLWSRRIDTLVIGGGLSLVFGVVASVASVASARTGEWLLVAFMHLGLAVNYPHYAATYQLVVRERGKAPRSYRLLLASIPFALVALVLAVASQGTVLPLLVRLYLVWSPYHYAKQHFGLAAMYSGRSGRRLSVLEKRLLVTAFVLQAAFSIITLSAASLDPTATGTGDLVLPPLLSSSWYAVAVLCVVASLALFALVVAEHRRRTGAGLHPMVLLLFTVSFVWFVVPNLWLPGHAEGPWVGDRIALWLPLAVPFFHCLQYLGVAAHRQRTTGPVRPVFLMAGLMVLGYVLFEVTALVLHVAAGVETTISLLLMASLVNVHHFWLDGIVWRSPKVPAVTPQPVLTPA